MRPPTMSNFEVDLFADMDNARMLVASEEQAGPDASAGPSAPPAAQAPGSGNDVSDDDVFGRAGAGSPTAPAGPAAVGGAQGSSSDSDDPMPQVVEYTDKVTFLGVPLKLPIDAVADDQFAFDTHEDGFDAMDSVDDASRPPVFLPGEQFDVVLNRLVDVVTEWKQFDGDALTPGKTRAVKATAAAFQYGSTHAEPVEDEQYGCEDGDDSDEECERAGGKSGARPERVRAIVDAMMDISKGGPMPTGKDARALVDEFKLDLPRATAMWVQVAKGKGRITDEIFKSVKEKKNIQLSGFTNLYATRSTTYDEVVQFEGKMRYDAMGRPSSKPQNHLLCSTGRNLSDMQRSVYIRSVPPVPGGGGDNDGAASGFEWLKERRAEYMYTRFSNTASPVEIPLNITDLATEKPLKFEKGMFRINAVFTWDMVKKHLALPQEGDEHSLENYYITVRYDVGRSIGEGGLDVIVPHAVFGGLSKPQYHRRARKRPMEESPAVYPYASDASSVVSGGVVSRSSYASITTAKSFASSTIKPISSSSVAGGLVEDVVLKKQPRLAEAVAFTERATDDQRDASRILYIPKGVGSTEVLRLDTHRPPEWFERRNNTDLWYLPSMDPEKFMADLRIGKNNESSEFHAVAYVGVMNVDATEKARNAIEQQLVGFKTSRRIYCALKDVFETEPPFERPVGAKAFALPSEVDQYGECIDSSRYALPSFRVRAKARKDEASKFTHLMPAFRHADSWIDDLIMFGYSNESLQHLESKSEQWEQYLSTSTTLRSDLADQVLAYFAALYDVYLQPDRCAALHVYLLSLSHMATGGDSVVPIVGYLKDVGYLITLSLVRSILFLRGYRERANVASDLVVEAIRVLMIASGDTAQLDLPTTVDTYKEYVRDNINQDGSDRRWRAALDILSASPESIVRATDATNEDEELLSNLYTQLVAHMQTHQARGQSSPISTHLKGQDPRKWADIEWIDTLMRLHLEDAQKKVTRYRKYYPSTCYDLFEILKRGDITMFLTLCNKNGAEKPAIPDLFDGVNDAETGAAPHASTAADEAPAAPAPAPTDQASASDAQDTIDPSSLNRSDVDKAFPPRRINTVIRQALYYYLLTMFDVNLKTELVKKDIDQHVILMIWYVLRYQKTDFAPNIPNAAEIDKIIEAEKTGKANWAAKLVPGKLESNTPKVYKVVKGLKTLNEQDGEAKAVYDYLLENARDKFRSVSVAGVDGKLLMIQALDALNSDVASASGNSSVPVAPAPAPAVAPAPEPAQAPAVAPAAPIAPDSGSNDVDMQLGGANAGDDTDDDGDLFSGMDTSAALRGNDTHAFHLDVGCAVDLLCQIYETGVPVYEGGGSEPPQPALPDAASLPFEHHLTRLIAVHNLAFQVAADAVYCEATPGMQRLTPPKLEGAGANQTRTTELSYANLAYRTRYDLLVSSATELNMRTKFDWMTDDLRRLKSSIASTDVLENDQGIDVNGNVLVVPARRAQKLNKQRMLVPETVEEGTCPRPNIDNFVKSGDHHELPKTQECDPRRWTWIGSFCTSYEGAPPVTIQPGRHRLASYAFFDLPKVPALVCDFTTSTNNTVADRLYVCNATLQRSELEQIYAEHAWAGMITDAEDDGWKLRMSKDTKDRYDYLKKFVSVVEFATYLSLIKRSSPDWLVKQRKLDIADFPMLDRLVRFLKNGKADSGPEQQTGATPDSAANVPEFGVSYDIGEKDTFHVNLNFLRFLELNTAEEDAFVQYTYDDYLLHVYSLYSRVYGMTTAFTGKRPRKAVSTTILRTQLRDVSYQLVKLRHSFQALKVALLAKDFTSEDNAEMNSKLAKVADLTGGQKGANVTNAWANGGILHSSIREDGGGDSTTAIVREIDSELRNLSTALDETKSILLELSFVERCGKQLYEKAFGGSNMNNQDIADCVVAKNGHYYAEDMASIALSKTRQYWATPHKNYIKNKPLEVNWSDKRVPVSLGYLFPAASASSESQWSSDVMPSASNNDHGIHLEYKKYLNGLVQKAADNSNPEARVGSSFALPFSKWADKYARDRFLLSSYDRYATTDITSAAERLPTMSEIKTLYAARDGGYMLDSLDGTPNRFAPSPIHMNAVWFEELMRLHLGWAHSLTHRRNAGDVHPQNALNTVSTVLDMDIDTNGTESKQLYLRRRASSAGKVMDVTISRPVDIYDPYAVDADATARLDKFQIAARSLFSENDANRKLSDILREAPGITKEKYTELLSLPDFVYTDYTRDIEGMF